jgi:toxin ParE1/3/4
MAELTLTTRALNDLEQIFESLEEQSSQAATKLAENLDALQDRLSTFPELGRARDELAPGIRSIPVKPVFVVFYRLKGGRVEILRILHGHRDIASALVE